MAELLEKSSRSRHLGYHHVSDLPTFVGPIEPLRKSGSLENPDAKLFSQEGSSGLRKKTGKGSRKRRIKLFIKPKISNPLSKMISEPKPSHFLHNFLNFLHVGTRVVHEVASCFKLKNSWMEA